MVQGCSRYRDGSCFGTQVDRFVGKSTDHAIKVDFLHIWRMVIGLKRLIISKPIQREPQSV